MVTRPSFIGYWAQDAAPADIGDADVYVPQNPAYPEQVPNQYAAGWFVSPDVDDVKQPHQWINSWLQSVDWRLQEWHEGKNAWEPEINYIVNSVVLYAGKRYIAKQPSLNKVPTANAALWDEVAFYTKSDAEAAYASYLATWESHKADKTNSHNLTVAQISGMSKAEIDAAVATKDAAGKAHIALTNNPHAVTYAQIGILPVAGGTHTGPTNVARMLFNGNREVRKVGTDLELLNNTHTLGITDAGLVVLNAKELLTESNYKAMRMRNADTFKVPSPDFHLPLVCDINAYNSSFEGINYTSNATLSYVDKSGVSKVAAIDEPAFGIGGLQLRSNVVQSLVLPIRNIQGTIAMTLDNNTCLVGQGNLSKTNVLEYIITTEQAVKDIKIWYSILTPYQIATIGCNQ